MAKAPIKESIWLGGSLIVSEDPLSSWWGAYRQVVGMALEWSYTGEGNV